MSLAPATSLRLRHLLVAAFAFALVLTGDQWSKQAVLAAVADARLPVALTEWFNLVLVWNRGISFGMFAQADWGPLALKALALVLMLVLLSWLWTAKHWAQALALGMILGGAVGNLVDRFLHGAVVDFLDFHAGNWHYPAFNVADAGICIGVVILVLESIVHPEKAASAPAPDAAA